MKILHVATHAGVFRGGAVQLCRMALAQNRRGHSVAVVVNSPGSLSKNKRAESRATWTMLEQAGIPIHEADLESYWGRFKLRRLARKLGVEIVHAHRDDAFIAAHGFMSSLGSGARLVAQRGTTSIPSERVQERLRSPRTGAVAVVARAVADVLAQKCGVDPAKVRVVYGSVDTDLFAPRPPDAALRAEWNLPPEARVIGSISAYRKAKGLESLFRAVLPRLRADPNLHIFFLGKKVLKKIKPLTVAAGVRSQCHFPGHQADVARWLSIMDLTILAARDREGLSGVLRESLAMEVPVVSTDCSGNAEIVRDGVTGKLVPVGDEPAMEAAVAWALDHPAEMKAMAKEGRRWVVENCALDVQAAKLEAIYQSLLISKSLPPVETPAQAG